jgi:hypothetical protein
MTRTFTLSAIACAAWLSACSNAPEKDTKPTLATDTPPASTLSNIPEWFLKTPCDTDRSICGVASASSGDMQMAVDKATLDAKYYVADQLRGKMSAKLKRFVEETGGAQDPQLFQETSKVISNLFVDVNTAGYQVSHKAILQEGKGFRAYVMVEFPIGEANRVLLDETRKNQAVEAKLRASKAFAELESEVQTQRGK